MSLSSQKSSKLEAPLNSQFSTTNKSHAMHGAHAGVPLLPMPGTFGQQAGAAWQGAYGLGGALPEFMSEPIGAYGANSDNIGAIGTFAGSVGDVYGQQGEGGLPFGAGVNISYNPEQQWVFGAGIQGSF
jgi:opacity protein-like surface antigen